MSLLDDHTSNKYLLLIYIIVCAIVDIIGLILTIVYGSLEGNSDAKSLEIGAGAFLSIFQFLLTILSYPILLIV